MWCYLNKVTPSPVVGREVICSCAEREEKFENLWFREMATEDCVAAVCASAEDLKTIGGVGRPVIRQQLRR